MTKILDRFEKVIKLICAILFIGIMILMAAQVIMLYAGVLVRNSGNIGFDLLAKALPAVVSDIFALICDAGIVAFSAYWGINAVKLCDSLSKLKFADLKLPYNTIYAAEPVGAAIVCIFGIEVIVRRIIAIRKDGRKN